ncbi:UNVERIFIED_CONTAM: hypothetical protein NCL1_57040, partial [Trichonephila clavipes]
RGFSNGKIPQKLHKISDHYCKQYSLLQIAATACTSQRMLQLLQQLLQQLLPNHNSFDDKMHKSLLNGTISVCRGVLLPVPGNHQAQY